MRNKATKHSMIASNIFPLQFSNVIEIYPALNCFWQIQWIPYLKRKEKRELLLSIEESLYFRFKACSYSRELTITAKLLLIENIKFYCDVWDFVAVPKFTGWGSKQCYVEEKEVSLVRNNNIRDGMSYNTNKWAKQFSKWKVIPYYKEKQNLLNIARYYGKHLQ